MEDGGYEPVSYTHLNTLDTMKWISKINHVPQVALMSTNLADILRFCISAEEFVPLRREVEVLNRYVEIQKIRLSDQFSFLVKMCIRDRYRGK